MLSTYHTATFFQNVLDLHRPLYFINPFPNDKFETLPNYKNLQTIIANMMKIAGSSKQLLKALWEKEKLLVTSNFSFSYSVFKRLVMQTRKKARLVWERVNPFPHNDAF